MGEFDSASAIQRMIDIPEERVGHMPDLVGDLASGVDARMRELDLELRKVYLLAMSYADSFWEEIHENREAGEFGSGLGVRIRFRDTSLEISFYTNSFRINHNGHKKIKATHIRKTGKNGYVERDLSKLVEWEKELVRVMERKFKPCRQMAQMIAKQKIQLKAFKKAAESVL